MKFNKIFIVLLFAASLLMPSSSFADVLGQVETFNVNSSFDNSARTSLSATLRHISEKGYFYVDNAYWDSLSGPQRASLQEQTVVLGDEFDKSIYPKEREILGAEPNPGVDKDPKITILLEDLTSNFGGYFETANSYPKTQAPTSNARDMVIVDVVTVGGLAKQFLAHEFQHLISLNNKEFTHNVTEDIWLNEARSEYAITAAGYSLSFSGSALERRLQIFLEKPSDSLTEWPNTIQDYSIASIFSEYLAEQYGAEIFSETLRSSLTGINSINQFLSANGHRERFPDVFMNWMIASYLNNSNLDQRYGYNREGLNNFKVTAQAKGSVRANTRYSDSIKPWQPVWYEFDSMNVGMDKAVKLLIEGDPTQNFLARYIAFGVDGSTRVGSIPIYAGRGQKYIMPEGTNKIALLLTNGTKVSDFSSSENSYPVTVSVSEVSLEEAKAAPEVLPIFGQIPDGYLIKKSGSQNYYVISGSYKRYLSPEVIKLYGHLDTTQAVYVSEETFNMYKTSNYVKYVNNDKVYAVWADNTKHWLNMSEAYFRSSGRDADAIFVISDLELNFYKTGVDVTR